MGWRNYFIKIGKANNGDESTIQTIVDFLDHHNNWTEYFDKEESDKMWTDDEVPGEKMQINIIYNQKDDEHWAYLGNGGGGSFSEAWQLKYFPEIKMYNSSDWPYYGKVNIFHQRIENEDDWTKWPLISLENFLST